MISNIIFDMGGVLIRWDPGQMLDELRLPEADRELLNRTVLRSPQWAQQDRGLIAEEQLLEFAKTKLPERLWDSAREMIYWFPRFLHPVPGMAELVRELKENGYHIYLLSNASVALRDYFHYIPGSECFDGLMVSAEEHLVKPTREIYDRLCDKFDLDKKSCFFVDDLPSNVEGAIFSGLNATVFHGDVALLRRELRAAGINCREEGEEYDH